MSNNSNYEVLNNFIEGMRGDFDQHAEGKNSYEFGMNGRLYSHNGVVSFSSIKGTKEVFRNDGIIKYLGYYAFEDELILFLKCKPSFAIIDKEDSFKIKYDDVYNVISYPMSINGYGNEVILNEFNHTERTYKKPNFEAEKDRFFNIPFSCVNSTGNEIKMSDYYQEIITDDVKLCEIDFNTQNPNLDGNIDCIVSLKKDNNGGIQSSIVWSGYMNWNLDAKIVTHGIEENNFYKRVYFTDYINPLRVINLKDSDIKKRKASEFNTAQNTVLLQPIIKEIKDNGSLPSGTMMYCYRLITKNGSQTEFSPISEPVMIYPSSSGEKIKGGSIGEKTPKSVVVTCNIVGWEKYETIECIALEYEAKNSPTAIRKLGVKKCSAVVEFEHLGNEPEFSSSLTLSDILVRKNTWKYCSDITSKRNKLIAAGLRNDPLPSSISNITYDFTLKGWDENGNTHNCLINPKPDKFKYIPIGLNQNLILASKKIIHKIEVLGPFALTLKNNATGFSYSKNFFSDSIVFYKDFTREVYNWLKEVKSDSDFEHKFPNINISLYQGKILFERIDDDIKTDLLDINLTSNSTQIVIDIEDNTEFINIDGIKDNLVRGYISNGYSKGNGIKVTFTSERELIMKGDRLEKNTPIVNSFKPSFKKGFMKGEIYRLGLQLYDKEGSSLFVIPLGDVKIPEIGEKKSEIDELGNKINTNEKYANSIIEDDEMFIERILLNVDVRLSCEVQKIVSMYQLVYVERDTNQNRTIVAQGISAPLQRVVDYPLWHFADRGNDDKQMKSRSFMTPEIIRSKWTLPYNGGPLYDLQGIEMDTDENYIESDVYEERPNAEINSIKTRVIVNKSMFYFDSPEFMYSQLGKDDLDGTSADVVARLNLEKEFNMSRKEKVHYPNYNNPWLNLINAHYIPPVYTNKGKFSWLHNNINDFSHKDSQTLGTFGVYCFVETPYKSELKSISKYAILNDGEVAGTARMDTLFAISNNAPSFHIYDKFFSFTWRTPRPERLYYGYDESYFGANFNNGAKTVFIKTNEDVFTKEFSNRRVFKFNGHSNHFVWHKDYGIGGVDTHALINIKSNSPDYVYGGRTEYAISNNKYVPLSRTVPVLSSSNNIQRLIVQGDVYTTLFSWLKVRPNQEEGEKVDICILNPTLVKSDKKSKKRLNKSIRRAGGSYYNVVVETKIEPKLVSGKTLYHQSPPYSTKEMDSTKYNEAYFQTNNLKTYIPKPFNFNDDPDMSNTLAVSDVKLNGDYKDAWTEFRVNNFYELDRNKGSIYNVVNFLDDVYAIQENQTSLLMIDENVMMASDNGAVSLQQGDGKGVSNHRIVSDYGTSIRRAVVNIVSNSKSLGGFTFFDEKRYEWVKVQQPIFIEKDLHLKMREIFRDDKIIDSEGWFDDEYKETNIRLRTKSGKYYTISFNEKFVAFNGYYNYNNDIYMIWNSNVYSPDNKNPNSLHQFNIGDYLSLFQDDKMMKIRITINVNPETVKIFKHWAGIININYPIERMIIKTNLGQERVIEGSHYWYKIREGRHSVPMKNETDWEDLRGEWATVEIEVKSKNNKKIDIFSFINFVRYSYQ